MQSYPDVVVLDIEGTMSPVSFRTDVVLPLVAQRLKDYLATTFDTKETQRIIQDIRELESSNGNIHHVPEKGCGKTEVVDGCCEWVAMSNVKKLPPLMQLQV